MRCMETCRKKGKGPWKNPRSANECEVCGTAWAAPNTASLKEQLKAELGGAKSTTGATQGPKKSYAQAVATGGTAPSQTVVGKVSTSSVEVPAVKEDGAFDMGTDTEEASHTTSVALPEEYDAVVRVLPTLCRWRTTPGAPQRSWTKCSPRRGEQTLQSSRRRRKA